MKVAVLVAASVTALAASMPSVAAAQPRKAADRLAEAYAQFLIGHHLDQDDDTDGAIAAYKRAMELDPTAADIPGELAALYLRQNKVQEAMSAAEQALKIEPANREGNRVLGVVYAALAETTRSGSGNRPRAAGRPQAGDENLTKAIRYLEAAIAGQGSEGDPNVRATLSRAYVLSGQYDKAIPILGDLVSEQPGWQDGPVLLAEAYSASGRSKDGIAWLEEHAGDDPRLLPTLGEFYERERRWKEAADVYGRAVQLSPRSADLRTRYATALVNAGGKENLTKARELFGGLIGARGVDAQRMLYLLSQTERRLGDVDAAETTARRLIAQNSKSPWGYYALAEALEARHAYQAVVTELAPVVAELRGKSADPAFDVALLLPHLGFAYQQLGDHANAIAMFEEARRLSPKDPAVAGYLAEANIVAKRYAAAADVAKAALADNPDDMRLVRLQAQALRQSGKADQGVALLEESVKKNGDDPSAYIALAQMYGDLERGADAVKVLQDAKTKFPTDSDIVFELGATFDKQKRFADAEAAFKQLIAVEPTNAAALNYLGYMLAERGERLDESVGYVKQALELEPDNGSYLDSLGWAYFKADKLQLAESNLKRAADQLKTNSVIQDHYGDVLLKLGRYEEAIAAFNRALSGDGDAIDRAVIDGKIRTARQKLRK